MLSPGKKYLSVLFCVNRVVQVCIIWLDGVHVLPGTHEQEEVAWTKTTQIRLKK